MTTSADFGRRKRRLARATRWVAYASMVVLAKTLVDGGYSNLFIGAQPAYPDGTTTFDKVALAVGCALVIGFLLAAMSAQRAEARAEAREHSARRPGA